MPRVVHLGELRRRQLRCTVIRHFGARAHWGENLDSLFDLQRALGSYGARLDQMNEAVAELDPYGVFANSFAERAGIRWPNAGQDFAQALGDSTCTCGVSAQPVCEYATRRTFANPCRATCSGVASTELVAGPCAALEWEQCSPLDAQTCVWRKQGAAADRTRTRATLLICAGATGRSSCAVARSDVNRSQRMPRARPRQIASDSHYHL